MYTFKQNTLVRWRIAGCMAVLAAGLAGCGGSDDKDSPPGTPGTPGTVDTFFAYVESRVASLLETDEPVNIDAVQATAPENTEPEAVK